jgi:phosphomannomutase
MVAADLWPSLRAQALRYADEDPDPVSQQELRKAVDAEERALVLAAFEPRLEFGTAGLRGPVGPGPARLNLQVCARFAWALGTFLGERPELAARGVVIGFDARRDSLRFARMIESILGGFGLPLWNATKPVPTPLVAFAVRYLRAGAGVVVTASHNPAGDNGIKLYDDEGIQIIAPWDADIEALMQAAPSYARMRQCASGARALEAEVAPAYHAQLRARAAAMPLGPRLRVAYSPLHGVGLSTLREVLGGQNVELSVVAEQADPDPDFPTTPFPNPEEPGVLGLLLELARREQVDFAIANDPDADRLALAVPDGTGDYVQLGGDEVGLLLCDALLEGRVGPPTCISSIVSSPGLDAWTHQHGGRVLRTLTGFKWLARAALSEPGYLLAYEEALGYCSAGPDGHTTPLDKDGLAAAVDLIAYTARLGSGLALLERLAEISNLIGVWACHPTSLRLPGAVGSGAAAGVMDRLRRAPPTSLAGDAVITVTDFLCDAEQRSPLLGRQDLLVLDTESRARMLIRPSGTEPKIKIYTHIVGAALGSTPQDYLQRRQELSLRARRMSEEVGTRLAAD